MKNTILFYQLQTFDKITYYNGFQILLSQIPEITEIFDSLHNL